MAPVLQGLGTALILAIVEQVRDRDEQTRAAASAEVRALQARMNPHFLFNALNTLAALSRVAPREVPRAVGRLRHFLRASFDQHERAAGSTGGRVDDCAYCIWTSRSLRFGEPIEGGADDRSGIIEGSNASFLASAAGGECGGTRTPLLATGRAAAARWSVRQDGG